MKTSRPTRPARNGAQFVQAICTLMVLSGIYVWSTTFDNDSVSLMAAPEKPAILSSKYWNEKFGYGFESTTGDTYKSVSASGADQVSIHPGDGVVYDDNSVRVSFYAGASIEDVEDQHISDVPRTYSRLPNGIAIIEGDLSSERAKTVLATLHSR